ncbi:hypothetical protein XELAEV_18021898mg [Xenopus laevis]|uniref:Uncharacterized protein n=1 Tax=Xenopus laevis TaxID=8355 RepID=A0A974D1D9_XENLA|nr:hypothetical protein XELAEV_18021898mg [Xenopus laevis]
MVTTVKYFTYNLIHHPPPFSGTLLQNKAGHAIERLEKCENLLPHICKCHNILFRGRKEIDMFVAALIFHLFSHLQGEGLWCAHTQLQLCTFAFCVNCKRNGVIWWSQSIVLFFIEKITANASNMAVHPVW